MEGFGIVEPSGSDTTVAVTRIFVSIKFTEALITLYGS
jgi:hypothetical protein